MHTTSLLRKCLPIGVILLFLGTALMPSTGQKIEKPASRGNRLYVGGNGPENYTTIQSAIDAANPGDTVYVYDDSSPYYENIVINKILNLLGENNETTVINGSIPQSDVVKITADSVTVSCFTICSSEGYLEGGVDVVSDFNVINRNIIKETSWGIFLVNSTSSTICNNTISDIESAGIMLYNANNNIVGWNTIKNIQHGSGVSCSESNNNIIRENIIHNTFVGIIIGGSNNTMITHNIIQKNLDLGISLLLSNNNIIQGNVIHNDNISIDINWSSEHNIIGENTISNSSQYGIRLNNSNNNTILKNNFLKNKRHAFFYLCTKNIWNQNYWGRPRILPKLIVGKIAKTNVTTGLWINIDWHPTFKPYGIP